MLFKLKNAKYRNHEIVKGDWMPTSTDIDLLNQRKKILNMMIEGVQDLPVVEDLITNTWELVRNAPLPVITGVRVEQSKEPVFQEKEKVKVKVKVKKRTSFKPNKIEVHGLPFPSIMAACKHFGLTKSYQKIANKIKAGIDPNSLFEKPKKADKKPERKLLSSDGSGKITVL